MEIWPHFLLHNSWQEEIKCPALIDAMSSAGTMELIWMRWQSWLAVYCQHHRFFSCLPFSPGHKVNLSLARESDTITPLSPDSLKGDETFWWSSSCCLQAAVCPRPTNLHVRRTRAGFQSDPNETLTLFTTHSLSFGSCTETQQHAPQPPMMCSISFVSHEVVKGEGEASVYLPFSVCVCMCMCQCVCVCVLICVNVFVLP